MRRVKGLLTGVALIVLSSISVYAVAQAARWGFEESQFKDQAEIGDWLGTHDLAEADEPTQTQLLLRIENEFRNGRDWDSIAADLSPADREQFDRNFSALTRRWLKSKVDEFHAVPTRRQEDYIERQLPALLSWQMPGRQDFSETDGGLPAELGGGLLVRLGDLAEELFNWMDEVGPAERRRIIEFWDALQGQAGRSVFHRPGLGEL